MAPELPPLHMRIRIKKGRGLWVSNAFGPENTLGQSGPRGHCCSVLHFSLMDIVSVPFQVTECPSVSPPLIAAPYCVIEMDHILYKSSLTDRLLLGVE